MRTGIESREIERLPEGWSQDQAKILKQKWEQAEVRMVRGPAALPGKVITAGCIVGTNEENVKVFGGAMANLKESPERERPVLWLTGENLQLGPIEAKIFFMAEWSNEAQKWGGLRDTGGVSNWPGHSGMTRAEAQEVGRLMAEVAKTILDKVAKADLMPEILTWGLIDAFMRTGDNFKKIRLEKEILALVRQYPGIRTGLLRHEDRSVRELVIGIVAKSARAVGQIGPGAR